ncbi:NAD(P)H-binding protein [Robertkochia aurantiaca]|uniref:NAD(P)H-binding protein n=1 Tax=Robertkochia aurantiaca TaxID=2873700 RepID=UPI001CC92100|nr:NAD(P)H-binding protein [Robertkochia sp. 3YJGBD-33]
MEGTTHKTAVILGATGLTGSILLQKLIEDDRYEQIRVFTRSPLNISHKKIEEIRTDLFKLDEHKKDFKAHDVFCCIGTTRAKTPDKETYKKIDYGIPVTAASISVEMGVENFIVISSMGANSKSRVFYNRTKGEMEESVLAKDIPNIYLLRPSIIGGKRTESRPGEWFFKRLFQVLDPLFLGNLKKYRLIDAEEIANAMVWLANHEEKSGCMESDSIRKLNKML